MRIFSMIIEIITSPFTFLLRNNFNSMNTNKKINPIFIFLMALIIVCVLVLVFYRSYIFKF